MDDDTTTTSAVELGESLPTKCFQFNDCCIYAIIVTDLNNKIYFLKVKHPINPLETPKF
jgi:hypothetical protein